MHTHIETPPSPKHTHIYVVAISSAADDLLRFQKTRWAKYQNHETRISPRHPSPTILQTRHNNRPILRNAHSPQPRPIRLHHKIHRQTQLPRPRSMHIRLSKTPRHNLRIIRNDSHIIPSTHQFPHFPLSAVRLVGEDFHHVFFGIAGGVGGAVAVLRDVEGFLGGVQEAEDVGRWGGVDDGGGD